MREVQSLTGCGDMKQHSCVEGGCVAPEPGHLPSEDGVEIQQCAQSRPPTNYQKMGAFQGRVENSEKTCEQPLSHVRDYAEVGLTHSGIVLHTCLPVFPECGAKGPVIPLPPVLRPELTEAGARPAGQELS